MEGFDVLWAKRADFKDRLYASDAAATLGTVKLL